jgi:hypothetical protein
MNLGAKAKVGHVCQQNTVRHVQPEEGMNTNAVIVTNSPRQKDGYVPMLRRNLTNAFQTVGLGLPVAIVLFALIRKAMEHKR